MFAGVVAAAAGVISVPAGLIQLVIGRKVGIAPFWLMVSGIATAVLIYRPLEKRLVDLTDKFLFQKKFDYQKLLKDASAGISEIKSLKHLLSLVVHFVTMRVRVKSAGVLVYDEKDQFFKLLNLRGYPAHDRSSSRGYVLSRTDPLIGYLAEEKSPLEIEQVKEACRNLTPSPSATPQRRSRLNVTYVSGGKGKSAGDYDFSQIRLRMEELKASCLVPSFLADNLKNVLVLGEKKSGDPYTEEDLNVLFTLAQESAIAIENARLYDQAVNKSAELEFSAIL